MLEPGAAIAEDAFLGGRIRLRQPRRGHRAGTDAVLLAALAAPREGETVYDLGAGVGAVGLIVAARTKARVVFVEREPVLAALCRENIALNRLEARARVIEADLLAPAAARRERGLVPQSADWVVTNPPFLEEGRGRRSPDAAARLSARASRRRPEALDRGRRRSPATEGAPGADSPGGRARRVPRPSRARFRGGRDPPGPSRSGRGGDPDSHHRGEGEPRAVTASAGPRAA